MAKKQQKVQPVEPAPASDMEKKRMLIIGGIVVASIVVIVALAMFSNLFVGQAFLTAETVEQADVPIGKAGIFLEPGTTVAPGDSPEFVIYANIKSDNPNLNDADTVHLLFKYDNMVLDRFDAPDHMKLVNEDLSQTKVIEAVAIVADYENTLVDYMSSTGVVELARLRFDIGELATGQGKISFDEIQVYGNGEPLIDQNNLVNAQFVIEQADTCVDPDGKVDTGAGTYVATSITQATTVTKGTESGVDTCDSEAIVREYYCKVENDVPTIKSTSIYCQNSMVCVDGACVTPPVDTTVQNCINSCGDEYDDCTDELSNSVCAGYEATCINACSAPVDSDNDGVADASDNCPSVPNVGQSNTDGDGFGDACDTDLDGDGIPNDEEILNCGDDPNLNCGQLPDADGDGTPDAQDECPNDASNTCNDTSAVYQNCLNDCGDEYDDCTDELSNSVCAGYEDSCITACAPPGPIVDVPDEYCGNAKTVGNEACDDGNSALGDGCTPQCAVEEGWLCQQYEGEPANCQQQATPGDVGDTPAVCDGNGPKAKAVVACILHHIKELEKVENDPSNLQYAQAVATGAKEYFKLQ